VKNNFVADTNVLVSAALSPRSTNALALKKALKLGKIVYSHATWSEFLAVLFRSKFDKYFSIESREKIQNLFLSQFDEVEVEVSVKACRDLKDDMFLELALAAEASCIITGDPDLLVLHPFRNIPILNAGDFLINF